MNKVQVNSITELLEALTEAKNFESATVIEIASGYYGPLDLVSQFKRYEPKAHVTIQGSANYDTVFSKIKLLGENITLSGLCVENIAVGYEGGLIYLPKNNYFGNSKNININNCLIVGQKGACISDGIRAFGDDILISNCLVTHTKMAISVEGSEARIEYNKVKFFSGDACRIIGSRSTVEGNIFLDSVIQSANHNDLLQFFPPNNDTSIRLEQNVVRNNIMISDTQSVERYFWPTYLPRTECQGIGSFDGLNSYYLIENNYISCSIYHGLTIMGSRDAVVRDNCVTQVYAGSEIDPWVKVETEEKKQNWRDTIPNANNIVENNIEFTGEDAEHILSEITTILLAVDPDNKICGVNRLLPHLIPNREEPQQEPDVLSEALLDQEVDLYGEIPLGFVADETKSPKLSYTIELSVYDDGSVKFGKPVMV